MLNRFKLIVEDMRGLIDETRSAPSVISSERSESRNLFLLAVSGGVDSMCLADLWVRAFGPESCAIAHCNFNLRAEDSNADEALVTQWALSHGVRLHKVSFDTIQYASENGISIEMAARELRYRWFGELCSEHGYAAVVVAHHADDNAETLVLNMIRGAGLKGLTGMKPVSSLPYADNASLRGASVTWQSPCLLRPLLTFTRKQIEGHAFAWKVPYREDKTNSSVEYRRNSIRHEVFPLFARMNPSYVRTLNREMTYLDDASAIVDEWCRAHVAMVVSGREGSVTISTEALLAILQWRYLLYYILEPYGFNTATLESLESLLMSDRTLSGKRFESDDYVLLVERRELVINRKEGFDPLSFRPSVASGEIFSQIPAPGTYHVNGSRVIVETLDWTPGMSLKQPEGIIILDAAKLRFPFVLRKWRSGDWMVPLGMRGKKKISDLFTDLKYSHMDKERAVIIVDCVADLTEQQHVAGVAGVRIDDRYKVSDNTEIIIRITIS